MIDIPDRIDVGLPGPQGEKGEPPFTGAMAHDVAPGSPATATIVNDTLDIGVPSGLPGRDFRINDQIADKTKLPTTGLATGDRYQTLDDMHVHEWNGGKWLDLGVFGSTSLTVTEPLAGTGTLTQPLNLAYGSGLTVSDHRLTVALTDAMIAAFISQPLTSAAIKALVGSGGGGTGTKVTGVRITSTVNHVDVGKDITLTCEVLPSTASNKTVTWLSSSPSIAAFEKTGGAANSKILTGKSDGTVTVTVTTADGGYTASMNIGVGTGTAPTPSQLPQSYAIIDGETPPSSMPVGARLVQLNNDSLVLYEMRGSNTFALTADEEPTAILATDIEQLPSNPPSGTRALVLADDSITLWSDGNPTTGSLRLLAEGEATPTNLNVGDRVLTVGDSLTLSQWQ